jgi:hypothetical protein
MRRWWEGLRRPEEPWGDCGSDDRRSVTGKGGGKRRLGGRSYIHGQGVAYGEQHWWLKEGIFWLDTMLEGFKTLTLIRVGCVYIYIRKGVHGWVKAHNP